MLLRQGGMKGIAIQLTSRQEQSKRKIREQTSSPTFTGEEGHSYSFPFHRPTTSKSSQSSTLAITNINLPDNTMCFNTGSSLDRWSQKRTRLRSAKTPKIPTEFDKDFCYETLETDLSILLNDPPSPSQSHSGSLDNLHYEVHSDIEKLLEETQRSSKENNKDKNVCSKKRTKESKKKKKAKSIRFSKSPSPQTEQVIRVDVTSNISTNECKRDDVQMPTLEEVRNRNINGRNSELKINKSLSVREMDDEEFIIRCRQLALRQKGRRLR